MTKGKCDNGLRIGQIGRDRSRQFVVSNVDYLQFLETDHVRRKSTIKVIVYKYQFNHPPIFIDGHPVVERDQDVAVGQRFRSVLAEYDTVLKRNTVQPGLEYSLVRHT